MEVYARAHHSKCIHVHIFSDDKNVPVHTHNETYCTKIDLYACIHVC